MCINAHKKHIICYIWIWMIICALRVYLCACMRVCAQQFSPPGGLITVSWQITGEHSLSAIRIWLYFLSQWDLWVTLCNFSLSLWSSPTHSGAEVEGSAAEPEAVSQSFFSGRTQSNSLLFPCTCTSQRSTCVLLQVCVRVCTCVCVYMPGHCLARWVPSRLVKERLLE